MPRLKSRCRQLADRVDALLDRMDAIESDRTEDRDEIQVEFPADDEIRFPKGENEKLVSQIDALQQSLEEEKEAVDQVVEERDHIKGLAITLTEDNAILKKDRREFEVANNSLKVLNTRLESDKSELLKENMVLKAEVENVDAQRLKTANDKLTQRNYSLQHEIEAANALIRGLKAEVTKLQTDALKLHQAAAEWQVKYEQMRAAATETRIAAHRQINKLKRSARNRPTPAKTAPKPAKKKQPAKPAGRKAVTTQPTSHARRPAKPRKHAAKAG